MYKDVLKLYLITDTWAVRDGNLFDGVKTALENGVTCLQYREKHKPYEEKLEEGLTLQRLARQYQVPFIINDDLELAMALGADGVHLGQSDVEATHARKILGPDKIIGVTAKTIEQAQKAERAGADYIGVGAVFKTHTKSDAKSLSFDEIKAVIQSVRIPAVAIGGIDKNNVKQLQSLGVSGVAVVSGILSQEDIGEATRALVNWEMEENL